MLSLKLLLLLLQAGASPAPSGNDATLAFLSNDSFSMAEVFQDLERFWNPQLPHIRFAPGRSRFNRIEGLSLAAVAGWSLNPTDTKTLVGELRLGTADLVPNARIEMTGKNESRTSSLGLYYSLRASNEWGNPLALGASLGALFVGRDDGIYYRAAGVQYRLLDSARNVFDLRIFAERHRSARKKNDFSFADAFGHHHFHSNLVADDADLVGAKAVFTVVRGEYAINPRLFGEAKFEMATGDFDYTRGMVEGIASLPFLKKSLLASLTVSGGASGGSLPLQRNWFLGGSRSVRGQAIGVMSGNSFWMSQAELGTVNVFARPVLFFDAGWAGHRDDFATPGRIATGAGIGGSFFDGSLRLDIARGIWPGTAWRGSLYLEARM